MTYPKNHDHTPMIIGYPYRIINLYTVIIQLIAILCF